METIGTIETKKSSVKFKRSRSSQACEVCHARKVRCDAMIHIPCTNCVTFGCECTMPPPKERKNSRKKPSEPLNDLQLQISTIKRKKNEPLAAISGRTAKIDRQKLLLKHSNRISFVGPTSAASLIAPSGSLQQAGAHYSCIDWAPIGLRKSIMKTRANLDTVQLEILRLKGAFHLPESGLCDELVNDYFTHVYPLGPIINKEKFMREYEQNTVSLLLLQSVLLAASRVSSSPLILDSEDSTYLASCTFYHRAKALYDAGYEDDPISIVQSLILFSEFWEGVDEIIGNSFYWIRLAITAAQGYGFHRELIKSAFSEQQRKEARILWWHLYIRDISVAVGYGRPRMILLEDCDIPMITLDDFPQEFSRVDAEVFIQSIKLSEIVAIVIQEQYSVHAEKLRQRQILATNHCDMIMSSWRNNLPSQLQYSPHHDRSITANVLNLTYYTTVILVHRSNMVKATHLNGKQYPSEGIVFRASRIIADICQKLLMKKQLKYCQAAIIPGLFYAGLTFVCHMDSKNAAIAKTAKASFEICNEALKEMGSFFLIAILISSLLEKFVTDENARAKLVTSLAKKDEIDSQAAVQNHEQPLNHSNQSQDQSQVFPQQFSIQSPIYSTPQDIPLSQIQNSLPVHQGAPQTIVQQNYPIQQPLRQQQQVHNHQKHRTVQGLQPHSLNPLSEQLAFPDLYLFTNNLPSNIDNLKFDPSQLFPSKDSICTNSDEGGSDMVNYNDLNSNIPDFGLNLPEFEFQNLGNSFSIHNLSSLNTYLDQGNGVIPSPHEPEIGSRIDSTSNIYSFVN